MVAPISHTSYREGKIIAVKLKKGWFGRVGVSVRFEVQKKTFTHPYHTGKHEPPWEDAGVSEWKEVRASDIDLMVRVANLLRGVVE